MTSDNSQTQSIVLIVNVNSGCKFKSTATSDETAIVQGSVHV